MSDEAVVAPLVVAYYNWLTDNPGGISSDELLAKRLTPTQKKMLLARMNDVNALFSVTSPIHEAAGRKHPSIK